MPEINSATTRSTNQATYTPVKIEDKNMLYQLKRSWEKWGFGSALKLNIYELDIIGQSTEDEELLKVVNTLKDSIPTLGTPSALRSVENFGELEIDSMIEFGERLISLRENIIQYVSELFDEYVSSSELTKAYAINKNLDGWIESEKIVPGFESGRIYFRTKEELINENKKVDSNETNNKKAIGKKITSEYKLVIPKNEKLQEIRKDNTKLSSVLDWHKGNNEIRIKSQSLDIGNYLQEVISKESNITVLDDNNYRIKLLDHTRDLVTAFKKRMVDPAVGYMHLERITFTPLEAVRGDLLYTVPLAPAEEVNISHKQWSNTTEEFEKIVTDFLEDYSEQGVTEKTDMSQSTNSQSQHSSQYNLGVNASGGWGPVNISTSFGYSVADSSSKSEQFSRNQSINITRQASTRVKKENKVSFKVLSSYGNEDQTVRRIKNPYDDRVIRIDYYNLMRKWQVKLYRYGIRLTYDINIPDPGYEILDKLTELDELKKKQYAQEFSFVITPDMITRNNYMEYMKVYGVTIDVPPLETYNILKSVTRKWEEHEDAQPPFFETVDFSVNNDYYISEVSTSGSNAWGTRPDFEFEIINVDDLIGKSGDLSLVFEAWEVVSAYINLDVTVTLKPEVFTRWQLKAWTAIRDAAQADFAQNSQKIRDRIQQLTDELSIDDPLTLRKIEREEIMKGVLRWLFGPNFRFVPEGLPDNLYGPDKVVINEEVWSRVLAHGEIIKFLHHAIEWENMNYVLYPYFWSQPSQWDFKKFLEHPDFLHRTFLKSGSARVVLTIRPGFEEDFVKLMETGSLDGDASTSPYLTIAQELEDYAKTNYPGIPPANPEEADRLNAGKEIGFWYEYTPTSALDIALR